MAENRPPGCENCKKPCTTHLTQIVNGVMHKVDLCADCPNKADVDDPTGFSLADQLLGLGAVENIRESAEGTRCPSCGFTHADFKKSGRLGCPICYDTFCDGLDSVLRNMHRGTKHKGKTPARFQKREEIRTRINELQVTLASAVENERFEDAASLRDAIRQLEQRLQA